MKPGIYQRLTMEAYLRVPAVSASILGDVLDRCPAAAWFNSWLNPKPPESDSDAACNTGTVAHSILLEGGAHCVAVIDPNDHPAEKTLAIPAGWTNKSIKAARDAAIAAGKVPVFPEKMREIEAMVDAARAYIESLRESEPAIWAAFQPGGGESEVTMVWDDRGTLCRIRPDRITLDRKLIIDYKTGGTTAEPDTWGRTQMVRMGYYTSAAFYRRGVAALCGVTPAYVYLVQEQEAPFLCSLVGIDPAGREIGDEKIARALKEWASCDAAGAWPAYPNRVCYAELPPWEISRFEERRGGIPYDVEKMDWPAARESAHRLGFDHEHDPA